MDRPGLPILIGEKGKKIGQVIFFSLILVFLGLRFLYIEADFPEGITRSGVLYTDEGWYSNGALARVRLSELDRVKTASHSQGCRPALSVDGQKRSATMKYPRGKR